MHLQGRAARFRQARSHKGCVVEGWIRLQGRQSLPKRLPHALPEQRPHTAVLARILLQMTRGARRGYD